MTQASASRLWIRPISDREVPAVSSDGATETSDKRERNGNHLGENVILAIPSICSERDGESRQRVPADCEVAPVFQVSALGHLQRLPIGRFFVLIRITGKSDNPLTADTFDTAWDDALSGGGRVADVRGARNWREARYVGSSENVPAGRLDGTDHGERLWSVRSARRRVIPAVR